MTTGRINLFKVFMSKSVDAELSKVLHSGYIGEGKKVQEFEKAICDTTRSTYVVAVNSCTTAITLALKLAGVGPGTYVISTPMTCLATNEPILNLGANVIWADVDKTTGNISVDSVSELLKTYSHLNIKAILCVHWAGQSCNTLALRMLAERHGVRLIEDAAHAFGGASDVPGRYVGEDSDLCCFSFQAIKHVTCGDGGVLVCKKKEDYERAKLLRWFGLDRTGSLALRCSQDPIEAGYKWHMNDIAATIGLCNIQHLNDILFDTASNAAEYDDSVEYCTPSSLFNSTYWLYPLLMDDRDDFVKYMDMKGIECSEVHVRNDKKTMFRGALRDTDMSGLEYFSERQVNIPVGWWLDAEDVKRVIEAIRSY